MSELAKMRAVAAAEFDTKFPPPSMELPGDEYDALEEQRKVEWGAWWEAWQLMAARQSAPDEIYEAIKHGDDAHRTWLKAALRAFFAGQPLPQYVPSGQSVPVVIKTWQERMGKSGPPITAMQAEIADLRAALALKKGE